MKICTSCTLPSRHTAVIAGQFYPRLCDAHYNSLVRTQMPSSGQASYDRGRDVESFQGDIQQPMVGGKINPEWTKLWPDRARQMFSQKDIEAAERKN